MLVGAVFACGATLALAYVAWQVVCYCADSLLDAVLCCHGVCKKRLRCCRPRRKASQSDVDLDYEDDQDDEAVDSRKTRTYVTSAVAE